MDDTQAKLENSLGKLQCVTVKAPRQIIDVGVVRVADTNTSVRSGPISSLYYVARLQADF